MAQGAGTGRRGFLVLGALGGAGLLVGCTAPSAEGRIGAAGQWPAGPQEVSLNAWLKIAADGSVVVATPRSEMGQGVHTALAMLVAEELGADWTRVRTEHVSGARVWSNPALMLNVVPFLPDDESFVARLGRASAMRAGWLLSLQVTGGSSSVRDAWEPMRLAGAAAREMLKAAAARRWGVTARELDAAAGRVSHGASGRSLEFGALAAEAAGQAAPRELVLKSPAQWRLIGRPLPRLDLPAKVNGSAAFGIDVRPPGSKLLHAAVLHCPVFGGRLARLDDREARSRRGVRQVFALGDRAVVVVADNGWRARQALAALQPTWNEGEHAGLDSAALSRRMRAELDAREGFAFRDAGGAADAVQRAGAAAIRAEYEVPFLAHAALEPVNCTAQFKDGRLTLWCPTQVPSLARWRAAEVAGIAQEDVTVHVPYLGGGFGRRLEVDMVEEAVGVALRTGGEPVQLLWSREQDFRHDFYRPAAVARFAAVLSADGRPVAWVHRLAAPSLGRATLQRLLPRLAMDAPDKNHVEGAFELPYAIAALEVRQLRVETPVPIGSWRSVGHSYNAFFTECFLDELAHAGRRDPLELRRMLLQARPRHRAVLELAAARAGWGRPLPAGRARGIALHESFGSICAQVAEVSLGPGRRIRVERVVCALDCGVVVNPDTVAAQLEGAIVYGLSAALGEAITVRDGRVEQGNFDSYEALRMDRMPVIETHLVASSAAPGGVGEPGTPPIAPAVGNALFALTGQRLRQLPFRLA